MKSIHVVIVILIFVVGFYLGTMFPQQEVPVTRQWDINVTDQGDKEDINKSTYPGGIKDGGNVTGQVVKDVPGSKAIIAKVVDGDTIDTKDGERVRLLGINTPEKGQFYYEEATDRLKELVLGKEVTLEKDITNRGKYNRLLRHVFVDSVHVNLLLVKEGYANAYSVSPDVKYLDEFNDAEKQAQDEGLGIWSKSSFRDCIGIAYFRYDAAGDDRYNLNDEYVKFRNSCSYAIGLGGWTVKDEATHIYTFPPTATLPPNVMIILYTGKGTDTANEFYWSGSTSIWNNDGDTLYLWDGEGKLVLSWGYEGG